MKFQVRVKMMLLKVLAVLSWFWTSTILAEVRPENKTVSVRLSLDSPLPFLKVPLDPWIDFDHGPRGRVEWVSEDRDISEYELRFRLGPVRPPLRPRKYTPLIGTGDLLRYNGGELRPLALPVLGALVDLTGDGKRDLVGTVVYTYSHHRPPGGIVCYPRVGSIDQFEFGDPVAIRYLDKSQSKDLKHLRAGYLHLDAADLNADGLVDLAYASPASGSHQNPRSAGRWIVLLLNTGRRDEGGLPIFADHGRIEHPERSWEPVRIVDLDHDGIQDLAIGSTWIRNTNPEGWPFQPGQPLKFDPGRGASFYDVDSDGLLDSVCLVRDRKAERTKYFDRVAWRRHQGGKIPHFGPACQVTGTFTTLGDVLFYDPSPVSKNAGSGGT